MNQTLLPKTPGRRITAEHNLISLINIVFLLLVFFMIAGRLGQSTIEGLELPVLKSDHSATQEHRQLQLSANGQIHIDGKPVNRSQLQIFIHQLADSAQNLDTPQIDIQADQNLSAAALDEVLSLLRESGILQIRLFVENLH